MNTPAENAPFPFIIDTHAHLELKPLVNDVEGAVYRAASVGVSVIICIGIDLTDAEVVLHIANQYEHVYAGIGFHPHNAEQATPEGMAKMKEMAAHPKVMAYGEIGLDFFRDWAPQDKQIAAFEEQLEVAKQLNKPVVIHLRDAYDMGLDMIEKAGPLPAGGVVHCFSGTMEDADRTLDLGLHISIPGTITYKKNELFREIVTTLPSNRILLETDCPFLSPEPLRGHTNEPANIIRTAEKVAEIRGVPFKQLARETTANAIRLFGLPYSV